MSQVSCGGIEDSIMWDNDANYFYYAHGPLGREEIGDQQVQGIDYAYTLQGWYNLGISYYNAHLYDSARYAWTKALQLKPGIQKPKTG